MKDRFADRPVITITIDIDWAPEECVVDALKLIQEYRISPTIFATDNIKTDLIAGYEHGIHPNFTGPAQDADDISNTISKCLNDFPDAAGLRAHALVFSTRHHFVVRDKFPEIEYLSNHYIAGQPNLGPYPVESQLPELPIFFMDNLWLEMNGSFDIKRILELASRPGLKVFDFHPYHLYINSLNPDHYTEARPDYHNADKLISHRREGTGARSVLIALLEEIKKQGWETATCIEIARNFKRDNAG